MNHIVLEDDRLRVTIDGTTGAFREIVHQQAGLSLIAQPDIAARHPFLIVFADGTTTCDWQKCVVRRGQSRQAVSVHWQLAHGLELTVQIELAAAVGELRCTLALQSPTRLPADPAQVVPADLAQAVPVAAVGYPYIAGIGRLGADAGLDELVHPYATGFLVRNPFDSLVPVAAETSGQEGVVLGLYPEGFSGSTMQFMSYSAVGQGGFYIAAEDSVGREKWLNFYRHHEGDLRLSVWHSPDDFDQRRSVAPEYATVVAALDGGTWYDAADRYKEWATNQPWTAEGPLWSQEDRCRWLLEDVGMCTFGINARHNRAPWLDEIDRIAGTPVLHLLGPNWANTGADYMNHLPGGLADWFPACFHPANIEVIRRNGDYLVPFEFDLLFGRDRRSADSAAGSLALQIIPKPTFSRDAYDFPFLCPTTLFTRDLHLARDRTLAGEYFVDGIYYDISVNNVRHVCAATTHDHAPGDTVALTRSYRDLLSDTGAAMSDAAGGARIPQGTEMINEQMIPRISFYQARAEASPCAPFEAGPFRNLIKTGGAEKLPLFAYIYHEFGPLRLDGWAKLSREQGDLVYFILGRVFVQGGLVELNYEFSPLEVLDGESEAPEEHYYPFAQRAYAIDAEIAGFVGRLSRMRVGPANRYLAYGAMRRPAPLAVEGDAEIELEYFLYNCSKSESVYEDRGSLRVPTILQGTWSYRDESFAWLLLNIAPEERVVEIVLDPPQLRSRQPGPYRLMLTREPGEAEELGVADRPRRITLTLPPRRPVMVEALPPIADWR